MKPFTILIERQRVDHARVTVIANDEIEAAQLVRDRAARDDVIWEGGTRDICVTAEASRG